MTFSASIDLDTLAATALCASDETARYYLCGVKLEITARATTYIATDGKRLFARHIELAKDEPDNELTGELIVPTASCKPFKRTKRSPSACTIRRLDDGRYAFDYCDESTVFRPVDGSFPDWRRVLPQNGATEGASAESSFDPEVSIAFSKIGKALDIGIPQIIPNGNAPAPVYFGSRDDLFGVIMPIRIGANRAMPEWANFATQAAKATEAA